MSRHDAEAASLKHCCRLARKQTQSPQFEEDGLGCRGTVSEVSVGA